MDIFGWVDKIKELIFELFTGGIRKFLDMITDLFRTSVENVQTQVSETPTEFSPELVENLRAISETAILPVAGLILTYIFCYEIYQMVVEKNRGGDFDTGQMIFLIIKTAVMISLVTNSFTITLAVFDLGKWITNHVPASALEIPESVTDKLVDSIPEGEIGTAMAMLLVTGIALVITFVMSGIIYLVAWGRIIAVLLYVSIAPLPFATFLNRDWIGSIGQSYVKNLLALMLQGYFMLVCLVIYAGLLDKVRQIVIEDGSAIYGLLLMIVSMGVLVVTLTRTHSLAKSVVGAF